MKPPLEDDYDDHVRLISKRWHVWCGDGWQPIMILATAQVRITPGVKRSAKMFDKVTFVCGGCDRDINHLLDDLKRHAMLQLAKMSPDVGKLP